MGPLTLCLTVRAQEVGGRQYGSRVAWLARESPFCVHKVKGGLVADMIISHFSDQSDAFGRDSC